MDQKVVVTKHAIDQMRARSPYRTTSEQTDEEISEWILHKWENGSPYDISLRQKLNKLTRYGDLDDLEHRRAKDGCIITRVGKNIVTVFYSRKGKGRDPNTLFEAMQQELKRG